MLLYLLLPPEDFHNKPFRYFFRVSASIIYLFSISVQGLYLNMTSWINVVHSGAEQLRTSLNTAPLYLIYLPNLAKEFCLYGWKVTPVWFCSLRLAKFTLYTRQPLMLKWIKLHCIQYTCSMNSKWLRTKASCLHTLCIVPEQLPERVWCTKLQSSFQNINVCHTTVASWPCSLLFTLTMVWIPVYTALKSGSEHFHTAFHSYRNHAKNHHSYVWTVALMYSSMFFFAGAMAIQYSVNITLIWYGMLWSLAIKVVTFFNSGVVVDSLYIWSFRFDGDMLFKSVVTPTCRRYNPKLTFLNFEYGKLYKQGCTCTK